MPQEMRILHFLSHGEIGGLERAIYQLLQAFQHDKAVRFAVAIGIQRGYYVERIRELDVPVLNLDLETGYSLNFRRRIVGEMKHYHIHHFHNPSPNQIIYSLLAGKRVHRVFSRRGGHFDYVSGHGLKNKVKHGITRILVQRSMDAIAGNTQHAARFAEEAYGLAKGSASVLYNGINFSMLDPSRSKREILDELSLSQDEFIVGTACHLLEWKRVDLLIKAFVKCTVNRKKLLIWGSGHKLDELRDLVRKLGADDSVRFCGEVTDIGNYLQVLDCFVLASDRGESFGNAVVEAMYFGIPSVIMEDSDGLREHITHHQTGYVARNIDDLANVMKEIFGEPERAKEIADRGSLWVQEQYSIEKMKQAYREFYMHVMGQGIKKQ